jgi:hypothetical protein
LDYFARLYQKDFVILWAETNIIKIDMKKILLSLLLAASAMQGWAQDPYEVRVKYRLDFP